MEDLYRAIHANPAFRKLEAEKSRLSWLLTIAVVVVYFSFILVVAFVPRLFAIPLYEGSTTTWGIPLGLFVILFSFALTGLYVHRANTRFDPARRELLDSVNLSRKEDGP